MTENLLVNSQSKKFSWYDEVIPVRGCHLSIEDIKSLVSDLHSINQKFGEAEIAALVPTEEVNVEDWSVHTARILDNAFRMSITINGHRELQIYSESLEVFDDPNLPKPITSIHITNEHAYRRNAQNTAPKNKISILLDFSKPALLDPNIFVSEATPNDGQAELTAQDFTFFNAVQNTIQKRLTTQRSWYSRIHDVFAYDVGLWLFALPVTLYLSAYYMNELIPIESAISHFRWPLFGYFLGIGLVFYRTLLAYTKWAFPVNILRENRDSALKHRLVLAAFSSWLIYELISVVIGLMSA